MERSITPPRRRVIASGRIAPRSAARRLMQAVSDLSAEALGAIVRWGTDGDVQQLLEDALAGRVRLAPQQVQEVRREADFRRVEATYDRVFGPVGGVRA